MKRILFAGTFLVAGFTAANASNPKTETKSDATVSTEAKASENIYYVTGVNASDPTLYDLSTTPNDDCGTGSSSPCQISTSLSLGSTVSKDAVDGQNNIHIDNRQEAFN